MDIFPRVVGDVSQHHPEIAHYQLLQRTHPRPKRPKNKFFRVIKFIGLLGRYWRTLPVLIRSLNVFRYGKDAASLELAYAAVPFLEHPPHDIVFCHFGPLGMHGLRLKQIGAAQGALVTVFHGYDMSSYLHTSGQAVYKDLFNAGDRFLPISDRWRNQLISLGCDPTKVFVHRMGISCDRFKFLTRILKPGCSVRVISVARLVEKKGIEYAIRAMAKLKNHPTKIQYTVIGDGPLRRTLEELIDELGVHEHVELVGWRSQAEVIDWLQQAHLMLLPSVVAQSGDQEGVPVILMEAMATGLPILSTQHSGIPELVQDGVSGFLVPERDPDALADKLAYLMEHSDLWPTMGRAGRAYVEEHFNIDRLNDRLVELFCGLYRGGNQFTVDDREI